MGGLLYRGAFVMVQAGHNRLKMLATDERVGLERQITIAHTPQYTEKRRERQPHAAFHLKLGHIVPTNRDTSLMTRGRGVV